MITDFKPLFLLVALILNSALALIVIIRSRRHLPEWAFVIAIVGVAAWALGHFLIEIEMNGHRFPFYISYMVTPLIASSFFVFVNLWPNAKFGESKMLILLSFFATIIMWALVLKPDFIIREVIFTKEMRFEGIAFGPFYRPVFGPFIIAFFAGSFITLLKKIYFSSGILRTQLWYIFSGVFISTVIGVTTNLFLTSFGNFSLFWIGPSATVIFSVLAVYAIFRHHLLNIRVIGTEVFAGLVVLIFFVQILLEKNTENISFRLILFLFVFLFSIILVRGTLREVETLRRLSEAKTEFISIASHQLRSPLTAIKGYVSMLLEGRFNSSPDESHQVLEKVYKSNERLIRLIDELLDISRIEEGRFEFTMEQVPFVSFISDIVDELQGAVDKSRLSLVFSNLGNEQYSILADPEKLRQVFQNLIDNAIRYTPKGKIKVWCEIRGNRIIAAVSDTGIGMGKEDLARIFERFSRGKTSSRHHTEGAGLGLYIARKIVEAHKGKMWAESAGPGNGSTFYVELPLKS